MIPTILHQTWKTEEIPENWQAAVKSCKDVNGNFEYMLWTDAKMEEFVKTNYPEFYPVYQSYAYQIQRCDVFRYLVLYKYGGVYLDMDTVCKQDLNPYLKYDIVFSTSFNIDSSYTNSFLMVIPEHSFIKFCIDNLPAYVNSYSYFGKHLHIMNSTGPYFLTKMLEKYNIEKLPNHYVLSKEEFAGDCSICNNGKCKGGKLFTHIKGQTWNSYDSLFYNYCFCNYKKIAGGVILFCILVYLFKMNKGKGVNKIVKRNFRVRK